MTDTQALDRLAAVAGIEDGWWDFFGNWRPVSAETKKAFLAAMGLDVADDAAVAASLHELETRPWRRWLEPVAVFDETWQDTPSVPLTVPADRDQETIDWVLEEELGITHSGCFRPAELELIEEREVDGAVCRRRRFHLPGMPPVGYHRLRMTAVDGAAASMVVAMAPARCFVPDGMDDGRKAWGIATQVYALRSPTDWGVGHYGALKDLAAGIGRLGGATVGVNPLHALFGSQPDKFSPYAPSSRRFLNTTYLDVEAIPEFRESNEAKRMFASPGFQAGLARIKGYPLVDYAEVAQAQRPLLDALYRTFRARHLDEDDERGRAFRAFQQAGGRFAELFCTFEALQEKYVREGNGYWRHWPEALRHPESPEVARFAADNRDRVEFHWWLQFVADEQLEAAQAAGKAAGMDIGLYRDLGVGIAGDGAEAWLEQDSLALGVSVGAPPDPLAPKGQDWGLVPFNPLGLREAAYAPFIGVMAANMSHAGALRLDHAMSLQRLYWVPAGAAADQGAYVRYPVDDLFRLVALESRRHRCLVIGEDLGTVPEGFRDRMDRAGIFAYRVMVFEKAGDRFKAPGEYDRQALCTFSTHDLPSARGWWNASDIVQREKLHLYPRDGMGGEEREARAADRRAIIAALVAEGLLPADFPEAGPLSDPQAAALAEGAHAFLERSSSRLMMVQIEDVLAVDTQMNLPGTTTQHPNWRRRFPLDVDALLADARLKDLAARLKASRGNAPI
ncbi:MAG: 4-alpha-glucanotransferase [Solirubrobacterales bacterium]